MSARQQPEGFILFAVIMLFTGIATVPALIYLVVVAIGTIIEGA